MSKLSMKKNPIETHDDAPRSQGGRHPRMGRYPVDPEVLHRPPSVGGAAVRRPRSRLAWRTALATLAILGLAAVVAGTAARADIIDRSKVTLGHLIDGSDAAVVGRVVDVAPLDDGAGRLVKLAIDEVVKTGPGLASEVILVAAPKDGPGYTLGQRILIFLRVPRTTGEKALIAKGAGAKALLGPDNEFGSIVLDSASADAIVEAARGRIPTLTGSGDDLRKRLLDEMGSPVDRVAEDASHDLHAFRDLTEVGKRADETARLHEAIARSAALGPDSFRRACDIAGRSGASATAETITAAALDLAESHPDEVATITDAAGKALRELDPAAAAEALGSAIGDGKERVHDEGLAARRVAATRLLGECGGEAARRILTEACAAGAQPEVRRAAIAGLARSCGDDDQAVDALLQTLLEAPCPKDRRTAAAALCSADSERATGALRFAAGALAEGNLKRFVNDLLVRPELARRELLDPSSAPSTAEKAAGAGH